MEPEVPVRELTNRIGRPIDDFYESVALDVLRAVPSFAAARSATVAALADLGYR
ncbi:hypothetical protein [Paractinoplanes ferrugineus]|uniref:hypothetical protein n=1 Tax=Paractinoplanes ferrugineus TaxID=113564 RepID=UPI001940A552|nr:hypothetical protein [Actinoplanes ferrugineus]